MWVDHVEAYNRDPMEAKLIPVEGGNPISINRDSTLIGRKQGLCDVVINRTCISKLQCLIIRTDGLLFVRDLASTNGTRVNGQRVTRGALLPGDELAFASVKFHVHLGPGDADADEHEVTEMLTPPPQEFGVIGFDDSPSDSDIRLLSDDSVV